MQYKLKIWIYYLCFYINLRIISGSSSMFYTVELTVQRVHDKLFLILLLQKIYIIIYINLEGNYISNKKSGLVLKYMLGCSIFVY